MTIRKGEKKEMKKETIEWGLEKIECKNNTCQIYFNTTHLNSVHIVIAEFPENIFVSASFHLKNCVRYLHIQILISRAEVDSYVL